MRGRFMASVVLLWACGTDRETRDYQAEDGWDASRENGGSPPEDAPSLEPTAELPSSQADGSGCDEPLPTPSWCTWVGSLDAVVVARIVSSAVLESPAVVGLGPEVIEEVESCAFTNDALQLRVEPLLWLKEPTEDVGRILDVRVGWGQLQNWRPAPARGEEGASPVWGGAVAGEEPLQPGRVIGLPLTKVSGENFWSLMGEQVFAWGQSEVAFADDGDGCVFRNPQLPADSDPEGVLNATERCGSDAVADALREERLVRWGSPLRAYAATCVLKSDLPE